MNAIDTLDDIKLLDSHPSEGDIEAEIIEGLLKDQKTLPPKYFYDKVGSELFDDITELAEYYPTRTEIGIMTDHVEEMATLIGPRASLIEFGSGSSSKTGRLLNAMHEPAAYVPVEISKDHLVNAARRIAKQYQHVEVLPVCADFTQPFDLPVPAVMPERNIVYFPGSTVGNFYPDQARALLKVMANIAKKGGGLLIGVDLKKDKQILEAAYNDAKGVTRAFNLNILKRLNRELGADFDIGSFSHRAIYNEELGRIEMHLVSNAFQTVKVGHHKVQFAKDEYILTECSHKFTVDQFAARAAEVGFSKEKVWVDADNLFSVHFYNYEGA
ncbi:MAG: L-histidine N(alpha)-methyltransferase [Gammaproteobacteria bacterium]